MHSPPLIHDLAVILGTAGIVTFLFRKIRQPVVLGYIVAGMIVGPFTPPHSFIKDLPSIQIWSELGVIFLMFALGLEFTFHKLARVGVSAGGTALVEVFGMAAIGYGCGRMMQWSPTDSLFLGGMLSISSTTIIIKALEELKLKTRRFSEVVFGVLIVEDLFAILILVALSTIGGTQTLFSWDLLYAAMKLLFIVGSWFVVGYFFIPSFLRYAGKHMDDETLTVLSTGLCLILVVVATHFDYSAALGAFIMGSILAETQQSHRIESLIQPVKSLFAAVFFVSVGMLVNPSVLIEHWDKVLFLTVATIIGKILTSGLGALLSGQTPKSSVQIGFSLAQIGEFSFIIAALGSTLKVTSDFLYPIAVAVSVVTTFTTPYLIAVSEKCGNWVEKKLPEKTLESLLRYSEKLKAPSSPENQKNVFFRNSLRFFSSGIAASLIFLLISHYGIPFLDAKIPGSPDLVGVAAWLGAIVLSAPFIWGMYFTTSVVSRLATVVWLGIMSSLFLETLLPLLATLVGMGIVFFMFYRRLERSYQWIEERFVSNLRKPEGASSNEMMEKLAPWDLHLVRIAVHPNSEFVGRRLKEIDVRHRYGLNIVVLQRGEKTISPPGADDLFLPGDSLLVLGTDQQIDSFATICSSPAESETGTAPLSDYALKRLVVFPESVLVGKTIADSGLREKAHVIVVGLERAGERLLNPQPSFALRPGDVLWLVGHHAI